MIELNSSMRRLLITLLFALPVTADAAIWRDPVTGLWFGNVCQTPQGWQIVAPQLVGSTCWSPGWRTYGFIANY